MGNQQLCCQNNDQTDTTPCKGPIPFPQDNEYREVAWGMQKLGAKFKPMWINRAKVGDYDVKFNIKYCGICHSDIHHGENYVGKTMYPIVPGHELIGTVTDIGSQVTKVKVGDNVGVGVIKDACLDCENCQKGDENYCIGHFTHTYNSRKKSEWHSTGNPDTQNFGGYSGSDVVYEHFVFKIPDKIPLSKAAPILCAGITMYDPLKYWGATLGKKMTIGIVGIGGLGTMGIKLASVLGHRVVAISSSPNKEAMAKQKGADAFVVSSDKQSMETEKQKIDLIINTISSPHQLSIYLPLLAINGTIVQIGLLTDDQKFNQLNLVDDRKSISGSLIGGISNTEELLALCAKHKMFPDTELVEASQIDWVWDQLQHKNKDGIRYVIDTQKSLQSDFVPK